MSETPDVHNVLEREIQNEIKTRIASVDAEWLESATAEDIETKYAEIEQSVRAEKEAQIRVDLAAAAEQAVTVAPYRISNQIPPGVAPITGYFEITTPAGEELDPDHKATFTFHSIKTNQAIAVELGPDGEIAVGSWNEEGEYVELTLVEYVGRPRFDTAQYHAP